MDYFFVLILIFVTILIGTYIKNNIWGDSNKPSTVFEYGRSWASYVAFIIPILSIRWFLNDDLVDASIRFLISLFSYTFFGFCLGCLWGIVKLKLKSNIRFDIKTKDNHLRKISDQFWEKSIIEFDTNRNQGLWARCFTENDGNENKAKSMYLRIRAEELFIKNSELNKTTIKNIEPLKNKPFEPFYINDEFLVNNDNIDFVYSFFNSRTIVNAYIMLKKIGFKITEKSSFYTNYYILKTNESEIRMNGKEVIRIATSLLEEIQKKSANIDFNKIPNFTNSKITNSKHLFFVLVISSFGFCFILLIYLVIFLLKIIR